MIPISKVDFKNTMRRLLRNRNFVKAPSLKVLLWQHRSWFDCYIYQYADVLGISNAERLMLAIAALLVFLAGPLGLHISLLRFIQPSKIVNYFSILGNFVLLLGQSFLPGMTGLYSLVGDLIFAIRWCSPPFMGIALEGTARGFQICRQPKSRHGHRVRSNHADPYKGMILDLWRFPNYDDIQILGRIRRSIFHLFCL